MRNLKMSEEQFEYLQKAMNLADKEAKKENFLVSNTLNWLIAKVLEAYTLEGDE